MLWILICFGASWEPVLYNRSNAFSPTNAQNTFVVNMNTLVMFQIVSDPSIPFLRMCFVDLDDFFCKQIIFYLPFTELATFPFVIGTARHRQYLTGKIDRITVFFMTGFNRLIRQTIPYFRGPFLLSNSANYFNRLFSISAI